MIFFLVHILCDAFFGSGLIRIATYAGSSWQTPLTFSHGYVLVWDGPADSVTAHSGTIALYAPDGHKLYTTSLITPDGFPAWAVSAAIAANGTVAVVYRAPAKSRTRVGIASIDQSGRVGSFVTTDPYSPGPICFADDGSIWVAGVQNPPIAADFMTIRRYSSSGGETAAFLPLTEISSLYEATYRLPFLPVIGGWRMRAAADRLGTIVDSVPYSWLEIDFAGKVLGRWDVATGLAVGAFTSSGAVYAQLKDTGRPPQLMVLDKANGNWNKTGATMDGLLLAADGEDLVYKMNTVPGNLLVWVRMRAQWQTPRQ